MAKFQYKSVLGAAPTLRYNFDLNSLTFDPASATTSTLAWKDSANNTIVAVGKNLDHDGGSAITGTITALYFRIGAGQELLSVTGLSLPANAIAGPLWIGDFDDMLQALSRKADTISGSIGNDVIDLGANGGNDKILALAGDDRVTANAGRNVFDGGDGIDTLSWENTFLDHSARRGIDLNVGKGKAINAWGQTDTIKGFEDFEGSKFADKMIGSKADEGFSGLGGADKIDGGGGIDRMNYFEETNWVGILGVTIDMTAKDADGWLTIMDGFGRNDRVRNIEHFWGTATADIFKGDDGDNLFRGYGGTDSFDGGIGSDTLDFSVTGNKALSIDLRLAVDQIANDGNSRTETAINMENVIGGGRDDSIALRSDASGFAIGNDGHDVLETGSATHAQVLTGGAGMDSFVFTQATTTKAGGALHEITDFVLADDDIDISDFGPSGMAQVAFVAGGAAFTNTGSTQARVVVNGTDSIVEIDLGGDTAVDHAILVKGVTGLDASHFSL